MTENRFALIIANYQYEDADLHQLVAPAQDAEALARVLKDPAIGGFEVQILVNEPSYKVRHDIEDFFDARKTSDLLLLYFSGHGVKDEEGRLHFATTDTKRKRLHSTAVSASFVNDMMRHSRSRRQILLLDCCYSGAFARGMLAKAAKKINTKENFEGRGRVVLTASDAMQYAFERDIIEGEALPSVFTRNLVHGLETGQADQDGDGVIILDELYDYVYDRVIEETPQQRPEKWDFGVQGKIIIARSPNPVVRLADTPLELQHSTEGLRSWGRREQDTRFVPIPQKIDRLLDLAYNLWWSWHLEGCTLYQKIDPALWEEVNHNPVKFLREVRQSLLDEAAESAEYLELYHRVIADFDTYSNFNETWFNQTYGDKVKGPIAYFSSEFGLHESLPIYSGGLGVLAGDLTKECSDLGISLVGVGFWYTQGYFKQEITPNSVQEAIYERVRLAEVPAQHAFTNDDKEVVVSVTLPARNGLPDRRVYAKVYKIQVGKVTLYLLDSNIYPNAPEDRELSARLYGGDEEMRLAQEKLLGIGGIRALRALKIEPAVFHMNEGHSAFLVLERARELVEKGFSFAEAAEIVRKTSVFTTQIPVPAGHDAFPFYMIDRYFPRWHERLKISHEEFLDLARQNQAWGPTFSMAVLALKVSSYHNGVSKLHGEALRKMWNWLWPNKSTDEVPITHVTNGIHTETWLASELKDLFDKYLGKDWVFRIDDHPMWDSIPLIPDEELWNVLNELRARLVNFARQRTRQRMIRLSMHADDIQAIANLLNPRALTIGFARRFATYKRPTLLFHDTERLKRIVYGDGKWPVQFVFAGKAHPRDEPGKAFIREVYHRSHEAGLVGHLAFIEDYDMNVAHHMVAGADVWLNTPRRSLEASGTSGQKAGLNGTLSFSILDGWWAEGYNGKNGWTIGDIEAEYESEEARNHADAISFYDVLEKEIVPAFYNRDATGIPRKWLKMVKESIRTIALQFSMTRMAKEYTSKLYVPSIG